MVSDGVTREQDRLEHKLANVRAQTEIVSNSDIEADQLLRLVVYAKHVLGTEERVIPKAKAHYSNLCKEATKTLTLCEETMQVIDALRGKVTSKYRKYARVTVNGNRAIAYMHQAKAGRVLIELAYREDGNPKDATKQGLVNVVQDCQMAYRAFNAFKREATIDEQVKLQSKLMPQLYALWLNVSLTLAAHAQNKGEQFIEAAKGTTIGELAEENAKRGIHSAYEAITWYSHVAKLAKRARKIYTDSDLKPVISYMQQNLKLIKENIQGWHKEGLLLDRLSLKLTYCALAMAAKTDNSL